MMTKCPFSSTHGAKVSKKRLGHVGSFCQMHRFEHPEHALRTVPPNTEVFLQRL